MKYIYSVALISAVALARCQEEIEKDYMGFAARFGKSPKDVDDLKMKMKKFDENDQIIKSMNSKVKGVTFGPNSTMDMEDDEYQRLLGLRIPEHAKENRENKGNSDYGKQQRENGRNLSSASNKNWVTEGKVTPVKNQGGCGSCWAFAATTVQESMESITFGTDPKRLSEQEGVDCVTASHGCGGGWMAHYWEYTKDGARGYNDYPEYNARDNACRTSPEDPISSTTFDYGYTWSTEETLEKLHQGPLTVALQAGSKCWQFYQQGILTAEVANTLGCATGIDHAVVLTGVMFNDDGNDGNDGDGNDGNDGDGNDGDGNDPIDCELEPEKCKRSCRKATRAEKRSQMCEGEEWNYEEWINKKGRLRKKCCQYTPITENVESDDAGFSVEYSDGNYPDGGNVDYWIIQNSWGRGWGEDGFIRIEVTYDDIGIIGMNQYINYMNVA